MKFFPTAEGYFNVETGKYVYNYTDHLGNVRVSYAKNGAGTEIIEESNYYPFGLKHEGYNGLTGNSAYNYMYNGKELQETGMYDYGARMYMPDLGRWGVHDPLSELQFAYSPYSYVYGNPIRFNDPTGMTGELATCPTCPNTSEFRPFINDLNNEYFYDRQTNTVSKVTQIEEVVVTGSKPLKTDMAGLSFTHQAFAPAIPVAAYLLEAAYYALVGYAAWDIADKTADAIKNRDIYEKNNEETTPKTFDIFPNVEQETDINGVPVDDSGIMKPFDASIPQEKWMDNFAKAKRGKESARQKDVKHGGDGEGIKGRGSKGDKHTKPRSGRESTKNRQKPGYKKYK